MADTVRIINLVSGLHSLDAKLDEDRVVRHTFKLLNEVLDLTGQATLDETKRNTELARAEALGKIRIEGAFDGDDGLAVPPAGQPPLTTTIVYALADTFIRVDASNGPITVFIPSAAANPDATIKIKNQSDSAFLVSLVPTGVDTVHARSPFRACGRFGVQIRSDGTSDWMIY